MRKATFIATVIVLVGATVALAAGPVTRTGSEAHGIRNPGACEVQPEGSDMHVKCTAGVGATGSTFVRYRFLRDVGASQGTGYGLGRPPRPGGMRGRSVDGPGAHTSGGGATLMLHPHPLRDLAAALTEGESQPHQISAGPGGS